MSICKVNVYSAFIFLVKEGEICCFLPSAWILVQFVSVFHFYFLPFLLRVQLWSSPLSMQVTNSPCWNSSFMTRGFFNTHEMLLVRATTQHCIPNCSFSILTTVLSLLLHYCLLFLYPSLLHFPQTSFCFLSFCNTRLFSHGTAVQHGQLEQLPAEDTFQTTSPYP